MSSIFFLEISTEIFEKKKTRCIFYLKKTEKYFKNYENLAEKF